MPQDLLNAPTFVGSFAMGYFDEDYTATVHFPRIDKHTERQIGRFITTWNVLERELNNAFPVIFRVDPTLCGCIYANLGTQAKLDILQSGIDSLTTALGSRLTRSSLKLLDHIRELNTKARNTVAHGIFERVVDPKDLRPEWHLIRTIARRQHSWVFHPSSAKHWRRITNAVESATRLWRRKTRALHEQLKFYSEEDIAAIVRLHGRDAEPIVLRRRKSQPLKRARSRDGQSKSKVAGPA